MTIAPLIGLGIGLAQSIFGGIKAKKAQRQLENMQSPTYTQNKSILDYYNTALQRYNVDPYSSNLYKMQSQNIQRGVAQGISGLQDRRSALGGISSLIKSQNDALLGAGVAAENEKNRRFGQLGSATQMKAAEDAKAFQINQMMPFERRYNLLAAKAGANARTANDGLQNIFRGLDAWNQYDMAKNYGSGGQSSNSQYAPITASNNPMYNRSLYQYGYVPQDERLPYN